ncbi:NADP-dependent oxidoreductase domain-containing protein [Trichoderma compactum]
MSTAESSPMPHPAEVPPTIPYLDHLPVELPVDSQQFTQCSQTLARLSRTSKRYRQIAHPYLYSQINIGPNDKTWLPRFLIFLWRRPDLRLLVKEINIPCLPKAFSVDPDTMGPIFDEIGSHFCLPRLFSWNSKACREECSENREPCNHFKRLLVLLAYLTPNVNSWSLVPPHNFWFSDLAEASWRTKLLYKASLTDPRALTSLQHLWVPGAQPFPFATDLSAQEAGLQLAGWLVPSLRTLRLRNAGIYRPIHRGFKLDNLKEIVIDFGLLTEAGLFSLVGACKVLESFYLYSRGNSPVFPNGFGDRSLRENHPFEFSPRHIVPAFSHLKGTLRTLAINRWDGARGETDHNITINTDNEALYATSPAWRGSAADRLMGSLKDFRVLETLKLDSTCLYHLRLGPSRPRIDLPGDHLTKRLPPSLRHLVLPGAPPQMLPALHALASSAASEFPSLRVVEATAAARDIRKRETSWRKYSGPRLLRDKYSKFIKPDAWKSLEKKFAEAGVQLIHINSGNTSCFARDALENAGLVGPESDEVDLDKAKELLDIFQSHGYTEIDTARYYGSGTSEEYLGKLKWQDRGLIIDTKIYPTVVLPTDEDKWTHRPEHLRECLGRSLKALQADKIAMWYLHGPDRSTPYVDTLRAVNELHKEGLFDRFGISNYTSWEVAQICEICDANNWIRPVAYQGVYNALHRTVEAELFPCLRHYNMGFYAYNPLAGGFLTGNIEKNTSVEKGSRFDPELVQGKGYRARYWNDACFTAVEMVRLAADKHGLRVAEVALRWMTNHSELGPGYPDAVLIGASSATHIEQNILDLEKAPLPEDVITALNKAWELVRPSAGKYWH